MHSIPFNLYIGSYELRSGHSASYSSSTDLVGEFRNSNNISPAANTLAVADFLATLETALQALGFSTSVVGSTIEITAPIGLDYNDLEISYSIRGVATGSTPIVSITQFSGGLPSVGGIVIS